MTTEELEAELVRLRGELLAKEVDRAMWQGRAEEWHADCTALNHRLRCLLEDMRQIRITLTSVLVRVKP